MTDLTTLAGPVLFQHVRKKSVWQTSLKTVMIHTLVYKITCFLCIIMEIIGFNGFYDIGAN